ncbi:MAG: hypothetical protein MZV64_11485 [Ignavibacteriales bacterium]|nr:hypothetical protein [Ignavibacteriales bacterium]MCK7518291.1 hypothetical protein [Ignavibacteriales bacterium]
MAPSSGLPVRIDPGLRCLRRQLRQPGGLGVLLCGEESGGCRSQGARLARRPEVPVVPLGPLLRSPSTLSTAGAVPVPIQGQSV